MASVSFVRGKWRALVRRPGMPQRSKSFEKRRDAERWGHKIEAEMDSGVVADPEKKNLRQLIEAYLKEHPNAGRSKKAALNAIADSALGGEMPQALTAARLIRYGRERKVSGPTLSIDLSFLGTLLKYARHVWGLSVPDNIPSARFALRAAGLLWKSQERDRRPTAEELVKIKAWFAEHSRLPMADIMDFAILTAMRDSEIAGLRWNDYSPETGTVLVRQRKHPRKKKTNDEVVPLLKAAVEIIERQPRGGELIFPFNPKTVSSIFPRACKATGVVDLRFHDLRHDGTSRLFEMGYQIQEVAMFTGHKDWKQLKRYTQLKPEALRRLG